MGATGRNSTRSVANVGDARQIARLYRAFGPEKAREMAAGRPEQLDLLAIVEQKEQNPANLAFAPSILCATSLPHRAPAKKCETTGRLIENKTNEIERRNGEATLILRPRSYIDPKSQKTVHVGVPYGATARLILINIMTNAYKSRSRHVVLGQSLSDWLRSLGIQPTGGATGSINRVKDQARRLTRCEWTATYELADEEVGLRDVRLTEDVLFDRDEMPKEIYLSEPFFNYLVSHPMALHQNVIAALRGSSLALDIYLWLTWRLPRQREDRGTFVSWPQLHAQLAPDQTCMRVFKARFLEYLPKVVAAYPEARFTEIKEGVKKGLLLERSERHIPRDAMRLIVDHKSR